MTHPDFQNIVEWDGPALLNAPGTATGTNSPLFPVSQWNGCILSTVITGGSVWWVSAGWWLDSAGTILAGEQEIGLDAGLDILSAPYLRHLGPYMRVTVTRLSGAGTIDLRVIGTNRIAPYPWPPRQPILFDQVVALGAGATATVTPRYYWAGPIDGFAQSTGNSYSMVLDYLDPFTGAYASYWAFDGRDNIAHAQVAVTPLGAWRARMINTGAAGFTLTWKMAPAVTGST